MALVRARRRRRRGRVLAGTGALQTEAEAGFGFALTGSQRQALAEIAGDMKAPHRMMRLLQGDVGSGKTVVALLAMLIAVESGGQAALMAPTEVLARQHHQVLQRLAAPAGVEIGLLTGREKGRARDSMLASLASGLTPVVVGTHALVQPDVAFRDLALAVIDEQHRFGVEQRLALGAKGNDADTLLMSATPIPRTLMLTAYGDLDVSRLVDKPPGRQPVDTRTVPLDRAEEVTGGDRPRLEERRQSVLGLPDGRGIRERRYRRRRGALPRPGRAAARPGRAGARPHEERRQGPRDGRVCRHRSESGGVDLLVATTVIEVGIDVPAATVMVIEHAERFGLAQLHQLRGRIGRGDQPSTCLLLYQPPLGEVARQRLAILRETEDGFRIAEEDLRLRGGGEVLGTRQSGLPQLRLADLAHHEKLVAVAHDDARLVLERDPSLSTAARRGAAPAAVPVPPRRGGAVPQRGMNRRMAAYNPTVSRLAPHLPPIREAAAVGPGEGRDPILGQRVLGARRKNGSPGLRSWELRKTRSRRRALRQLHCVMALLLAACTVGPDYQRPAAPVPLAYKEEAGWKQARPADAIDRGAWWSVFRDPVLDGLERQIDISNQNLKSAEAAFRQAEAIVAQARAGFFPTADINAAASRSRAADPVPA